MGTCWSRTGPMFDALEMHMLPVVIMVFASLVSFPFLPMLYLTPCSGKSVAGRYVVLCGARLIPELQQRKRVPGQSGTGTTAGSQTGRNEEFRELIRDRDRRCSFTGEVVFGTGGIGNFTGMEAAHIYPMSARYVVPDHLLTILGGRNKVNTLENGFLVGATFHRRFDAYQLGVDVQNNIIDFAGCDLRFSCHGEPFRFGGGPNDVRASRVLLADHFIQCLLHNFVLPVMF